MSLALALTGTGAASAGNADLPDIPAGNLGVKLQIVASGLDAFPTEVSPTVLVYIPDGSGRMVVGTLGGTIRMIDPASELLSTPFLTAAQSNNTIPSSFEAGMTSVAFHPDYAKAGTAGYGKFYTITTEPKDSAPADYGTDDGSIDHQDVIREWDMSTNGNTIGGNVYSGTTSSSRQVMRIDQPGPYHNVVDLAFDTQGYLYIASGDGNGVRADDGGPGRFESQLTNTIHGNVLKIDPLNPGSTDAARGSVSTNGQYRIPTDNPFYGQVGFLDEIYAYGLRSPYRMSFDRETGDLWLGDVGQGRREEVNLIVPGANYGWSLYEGTHTNDGTDPTGLTMPVLEYDHGDGVTVIGGFVYRGALIPELEGKYVFAELGQGRDSARLFYGVVDLDDPDYGSIYTFLIDGEGPIFPESNGPGNLLPDRILSIGEDADGELYLVAGEDPRPGSSSAPGGYIIKLVPEPGTLVLMVGFAPLLFRRRRPVGSTPHR